MTIDSNRLRSSIANKLGYRKKYRGRVLLEDVPELGLKRWSRLMPTRDLQDVASFEFTKTPFDVSWWVLSTEGRLVHDCPLMSVGGIGLETWSLDIMHSWHLGPLQQLVSLSLNYCLDTSLWAPPTKRDADWGSSPSKLNCTSGTKRCGRILNGKPKARKHLD